MNKQLKQCPICNSNLEIIEYHCPNCDTSIKGKFGIGELASLNATQQEFVKVFVCCQGSIKEVEKALGISYPTVKNRLGEVTKVLCPEKKEPAKSISPEILDEIEKGNLTVDEAIEKMKKSN
ncbi:MAG TPA: DUF2089 domain-containing protein [Candidatus Cloacimonetes bacterium]|nr:DUF2089 domain-containing protein [Candidatus Cloacimonadota bacterium]